MSESKNKKPSEYKGLEYRRTQRMPIRARWVKLVKITDKDHKWARRHGLVLTVERKNTILKGGNK